MQEHDASLNIPEEKGFAEELNALLPQDLPNRETLVAKAALHLEMIAETNKQFNLTRITSPREAAIKHVLDSVIPWRLFAESATLVDAGSGPGFPGIPLALVLPEVQVMLVESTRKKSRFLESVVLALGLENVQVFPERAEDWLKENPSPLVTARAVAPLKRAIPLFAAALRKGARLLLYKGPDSISEIVDASNEAKMARCKAGIALKYELPGGLGTRTIVEVVARTR